MVRGKFQFGTKSMTTAIVNAKVGRVKYEEFVERIRNLIEIGNVIRIVTVKVA